MRIAVVSSGLGHVQRGIEAWARSLAEMLHARGEDVVLYHGGGTHRVPNRLLRFRKRGDPLVRAWARLAPRFAWRWDWKAVYSLEQLSCARAMIRALRSEPADIVHTQDVILGRQLEAARHRGIIRAPTILAHGTDEDPAYLAPYTYLQHLSPEHMRKAESRMAALPPPGAAPRKHFCIPNFVDCGMFTPLRPGAQPDRAVLRARRGVPAAAFVIGCSAALKRSHKRIDALIEEVAGLPASVAGRAASGVWLVLAGAETGQTPQIRALARDRLGTRCVILANLPFAEMPDFYRMLDVYVHPAPDEYFGICFLEAMACGVPVVAHNSPTLQWIAGVKEPSAERSEGVLRGRGGWCVDVSRPGYVRDVLAELTTESRARGAEARRHVEATFSHEAVYPQFMEMYRRVVGRVTNDEQASDEYSNAL